MSDFEGILETGGVAAAELAASAVMARNKKPCPNCDAEMSGAFCAECGQARDTHRRTVWRLIKDYTEDLISFDSRVLRTLRALLFQPGELPLAFREGRTQRYVPPIRLYLFVSLLFFLFLSTTGIALMQFSIKIDSYRLTHDASGHVFRMENGRTKLEEGLRSDAKGNVYVAADKADKDDDDDDKDVPKAAQMAVGKIPLPDMKADGSVNNNLNEIPIFFQRIGSVRANLSPADRAVLASIDKDQQSDTESNNWFMKGLHATSQKLQTDPAALNGPLMTWIPRTLFILLPLYAIVLFLFYVRQRKSFYFVDHLVFSLSVHTAAFVVLVAAAIAAQVINGVWIGLFVFFALAAYVLLAMKRFYAQGWVITVVKWVFVGFIYGSFLLAPALAFAIIASMIWA